jgi:hypothetical protein
MATLLFAFQTTLSARWAKLPFRAVPVKRRPRAFRPGTFDPRNSAGTGRN